MSKTVEERLKALEDKVFGTGEEAGLIEEVKSIREELQDYSEDEVDPDDQDDEDD